MYYMQTEPLVDWLDKSRAKGGKIEKNDVAVICTQVLEVSWPLSYYLL